MRFATSIEIQAPRRYLQLEAAGLKRRVESDRESTLAGGAG